MPVYEYRCANGHTFELIQSMEDDPAVQCSECDAPVGRVFHPVAVHFKGSGFYTTDYGRERSPAAADSGGNGDSKDAAKAKASSDGAGPSEGGEKSESKSSSTDSQSSE